MARQIAHRNQKFESGRLRVPASKGVQRTDEGETREVATGLQLSRKRKRRPAEYDRLAAFAFPWSGSEIRGLHAHTRDIPICDISSLTSGLSFPPKLGPFLFGARKFGYWPK
jgi:hypothetical protein